MKKILFWNTDTQKDFMNPNGKLYVKGAEKIKATLKILTDFAKQHNIKVVNTADYHDDNSKEISANPDYINTFPEHCIIDSEGAEFIEETNPQDDTYAIDWSEIKLFLEFVVENRNITILKDKFDVFEGNPYTEEILNILKPDLVIVYGVAGDYCVDYAIRGLIKRGYQVDVVIDAIQSLKKAPIRAWIKLGVIPISTVNLIGLLSNKKMKLEITKQDRQALKKVFENFGRKKTEEEIFYDLCFAIMAPQTTFKNNTKVIQKLKELDFYYFGEAYEGYCGITQIEEILKPVRFYKNKTKYLLEAKKKFKIILSVIKDGIVILPVDSIELQGMPGIIKMNALLKRDWLITNVKGMGYKTASHFLRNMGNLDIAIIDTHIIKFLAEELCITFGLTYEEAVKEFKKQASKKEGYLSLEKLFQNIAKENDLSCAELDSFIWKNYSGTAWEDFKY